MKKSLVLLASVIALGSYVPSVSAEDNPNQKRIDEIEAQIKELKAELKELKGDSGTDIGEPQEVDGIIVTLLGVEFTDERNQFRDEVENVLKITYELENNSGEDLLYTPSDFDVYVDGKKMDTYPIGADMGTVNDGRSVEAVASFEISGTGKIEIEWEPWINMSDEKGIWEIELN